MKLRGLASADSREGDWRKLEAGIEDVEGWMKAMKILDGRPGMSLSRGLAYAASMPDPVPEAFLLT